MRRGSDTLSAGAPAARAASGIPEGELEWSGPAGLAALQARLRCTSPAPADFRASVRIGKHQDLTLVEWRSTAIAAQWRPRTPRMLVCLTLVLKGAARYRTGTGAWTAAGPGAGVLRCSGPTGFELPEGAHLRSLLVPIDLLPAHLRDERSLHEGALPSTALVRAFAVTLQEGFGDALAAGRLPPGVHSGLRGLAAGVLEEAAGAAASEDRPLRERILEHVDRHLDDVALGPQSVAAALGVSPRWVHRAFSTGGTTLSRHIRQRRVEAVAAFLQTQRRRPRLDAIAPVFGFGGRDQMSRAFSARFGTAIGEYWEQQSRVVPDEPPEA